MASTGATFSGALLVQFAKGRAQFSYRGQSEEPLLEVSSRVQRVIKGKVWHRSQNSQHSVLGYNALYTDLYKTKRYTDLTLFLVTNVSVLVLGLDTGLYIALVTELFIIFFQLRNSFTITSDADLVTLSGSIFSGNASDVQKKLASDVMHRCEILDITKLSYSA